MRDFTQSYFGYSVPCFYHDEQFGTVLFCAGELGEVAYYKQIDGNLDGLFEKAETNLAETINGVAHLFREGRRVAAAVADLNGDGRPEMVLGNYAGGAAYFEGATPPAHNAIAQHELLPLRVYPNPANHIICLESDQPLESVAIYDLYGRVILLVNNIEDNSAVINISCLPTGVYFVRAAHHAVSKFLKANSQ